MASQHLHPGFQPFGPVQSIYTINNHQTSPTFYQGQVYDIPPPAYGSSFRTPGYEDDFSYHGGSEASFQETSSPDMVYPQYDMPYQCSTDIRRDSCSTDIRRDSCSTDIRRDSCNTSQEDDDPVVKSRSSSPKRKRTTGALDENQRLEKRRIGNMVAARKFRGKRKDELETLRQMYTEQVEKNTALQAQLNEALTAKYKLSIELVEHLKMEQQQQQQTHQHVQHPQQGGAAMQPADGHLSDGEHGRYPVDWTHPRSEVETAGWSASCSMGMGIGVGYSEPQIQH